MAVINGQPRPEADGLSLAGFLRQEGFDEKRVACELNGDIVARADYDARMLTAIDVLEIVRFVGGG